MIATLILIIIAVVAGVAVYGLVTGLVAQTTTQQSPGSIVIDGASVKISGSDNVQVVVRNIGIRDETVTAVYVLNATDQSLLGAATSDISGSSIPQGRSNLVKATVSLSGVSSGDWVIVKVVTSDGASATYKVQTSS